MYSRPIRVSELAAWLLEKGYAEAADAEAMATAMTERFDVITDSNTPV